MCKIVYISLICNCCIFLSDNQNGQDVISNLWSNLCYRNHHAFYYTLGLQDHTQVQVPTYILCTDLLGTIKLRKIRSLTKCFA